ncbi:MAG: thiolase domain-containing protein [Nitrososphaeria archaeon]
MARKVAIAAASMTKFGNLIDKSLMDLLVEPSEQAINSAKVDRRKISSVYVSNVLGEISSRQISVATALADYLGIADVAAERIENGPASGASAVRYGYMEIASGNADVVLVAGAEKMRTAPTDVVTDLVSMMSHPEEEYPSGATMPALAAIFARLYMQKYSVKPEHLAMVAVKNHSNAMKNPYAHLRKEITVEQLLGPGSESFNPYVAEPLRLYDASPISDGGAAVLLMDLDTALSYTDKPVLIDGIGEATDALALQDRDDPTELRAVRRAAEKAYRMAGIGPERIDVAELHDAFTVLELAISEEVGFFKKGEAKEAVERGETSINGSKPINTSGGLKARGHPLGATGLAQIVEIFWQLRGEAGERQVRKAEYGLTVNMGGFGSNAVSIVLRRY